MKAQSLKTNLPSQMSGKRQASLANKVENRRYMAGLVFKSSWVENNNTQKKLNGSLYKGKSTRPAAPSH